MYIEFQRLGLWGFGFGAQDYAQHLGICVYIYTHKYVYMHIHIHMCIYIYICIDVLEDHS